MNPAALGNSTFQRELDLVPIPVTSPGFVEPEPSRTLQNDTAYATFDSENQHNMPQDTQ